MITLDIETFSRVNLKSAGLYAYAEDESTDILCACWAWDDGPVHAWVPSADQAFMDALQDIDGDRFFGPTVPVLLRNHIVGVIVPGGITHAWNASFERRVLNG